MANKKITKITSMEESGNSETGKTINPTEKELLNAMNVVDSIEFYFDERSLPFVDKVKEELKKNDCSRLQNARIVCLEIPKQKGGNFTDFAGIDIALEKYIQNPDAPMILTSFLPIKYNVFNPYRDKLDFLLSNSNVKFVDILKLPGELLNIFYEQNIERQEVLREEKREIFNKIFEKEIDYFIHSARYHLPNRQALTNVEQLSIILKQPEEKKSEQQKSFESKIVGLLELKYPIYKKVSREKKLGGVIATYEFLKKEELPEGMEFSGVFIDWDNCLYNLDTNEFNQHVLDMIKDYENQGKEIIIWTQGNIDIKQKLLQEKGLPYKIKSKIDYKGGIVEIAIDDSSPEKLLANARIKAKKHIKI